MSSESSQARAILRARARALARLPERTVEGESLVQVLEFRLANERYAVESRHVTEVYPLRSLTPLPSVPAFIAGIVNVRGRIVPVLDLKRFFGLPEVGLTDLHRIILISVRNLEMGLLADVSVGVRTIAVESLQSELPAASGAAGFVRGVSPDRLILLDMDRIAADPRIIVNEEVEI